MSKKTTTIFPLISAVISFIIAFLICGVGAFVLFPRFYGAMRRADTVLLFMLLIGLPTAVCSFYMPLWLSGFDITESGIRRSILGKTVLELRWEDIGEIRFALYGANAWLIVSKTGTHGYSFKEIRRKKDTMRILCCQKALLAIKKYYDGKIVDYPDDKYMLI
ncbi:MAG: hypothetical protein LBQ40_05300 [Clostridiales bacterium]|jgi:hypothetical protein|nr:hypothetical protein [Clostridiales bacterium]